MGYPTLIHKIGNYTNGMIVIISSDILFNHYKAFGVTVISIFAKITSRWGKICQFKRKDILDFVDISRAYFFRQNITAV